VWDVADDTSGKIPHSYTLTRFSLQDFAPYHLKPRRVERLTHGVRPVAGYAVTIRSLRGHVGRGTEAEAHDRLAFGCPTEAEAYESLAFGHVYLSSARQ